MKKELRIKNSTAEFLIFSGQAQQNGIEIRFEKEMLWMTQKLMAELFGCSVDNVALHLKNIFKIHELEESAVTEDFSATAADGKSYPPLLVFTSSAFATRMPRQCVCNARNHRSPSLPSPCWRSSPTRSLRTHTAAVGVPHQQTRAGPITKVHRHEFVQ